MKPIIILFAIFLLGCAQNEGKIGNMDEKDVVEFDNTNLFQTIYNSEEPWLLDLYAPWCGHCIKMADDWAKLATKFKGFVKVAKIDASQYPDYNELYGLKGFPHIVFIPGGIDST